MSTDVNVDKVRRVRDELVKRYGGLDGWIRHLQAMDRDRTAIARPLDCQQAGRQGNETPKILSQTNGQRRAITGIIDEAT